MDNTFENRLQAIEYELSQIAESEYLEELKKKFNNELDVDVVLNIIPSRDISFKTRSLLSAILNRLELNQQDRLDLEKYIVYGGGDNIEYLKQTLAVWVEWKDKILAILEGAPEEFDSLIEIFNYIEQHIQDSNIKLEEINNNILNLNEEVNKKLNIEDSPFEKGTGENSAVLKGGDNQANGLLSTAFGRKNKSTGVYGHSEGEFNESIGARAHSEGCYTKAEGSDSHAENEGSIARGINSHAEGYYTLASGITSHTEGASRANDPEYNPDEPAFAVVEKYLEARGQRSHAEGYATQAFGNQSHAEGIDTLAEGTNSHAEGQETQALSNNSHSEGNKTIAKGADTHAEGYHTTTNGWASHAEGIETYTTNQGEHAQGKYNVSTKSSSASEATIHSVGIGSSGKRKNAQEIKADGTHYIIGIGGYDGTNAVTPNRQGIIAKSVQEVINELVNIINEITISETN